MIDMLKRHEIQVLRRAGHSLAEVAKLAGVSRRSVVRVDDETAVLEIDNEAERVRRQIGRPSKAEGFRSFVVSQLAEEPELLSVELLRRAKLDGYKGGRSALYDLIPVDSVEAVTTGAALRGSSRGVQPARLR